MCRLYGFRSSVPSRVHHSLVVAENALAKQSTKHPDGWGVSYYQGRFPHLVRSEKTALEDGLFRELSGVLATRTLLAHIRQATAGKVGVLNCHPFQYGPWSFAHNGMIAGYTEESDVRQQLLEQIDGRFRAEVLGTTDSEVCFMLFLSRLARRTEDIMHESVTVTEVVDALKETHDLIIKMAPEGTLATEEEEDINRLTFMVTNGSVMVSTRYKRELYYSTYKSRCPESAECPAYDIARCEQEVKEGIVRHLIATSEHISDNPNVWIELEDTEYVSVNHAMYFRRGRL